MAGDDAALEWDGVAALVPVLGGKGPVAGSDPDRGSRLFPLGPDRSKAGPTALAGARQARGGEAERVNAVTGKWPPGEKYAPSTIAHCETAAIGRMALTHGAPVRSRRVEDPVVELDRPV